MRTKKAARSAAASLMGRVKSERKTLTARANGAKGGRPRKVATYKIVWSNGHAAGALPFLFTSRVEAEHAAREWKRDLVAIETTPAERQAARREYQWEVIEVTA